MRQSLFFKRTDDKAFGEAETLYQFNLFGSHFTAVDFVVVSQQMEQAVDEEKGELVVFAVPELLRYRGDFIDADDDTPQRSAREWVAWKAQDVGGFVDAAEFGIDRGDLVVAREDQFDLPVGQCIAYGLYRCEIVGFVGAIIYFYHS